MSQSTPIETNEIELLISKGVEPGAGVPRIRRRMKAYLLLLATGLLGFMAFAIASTYSDLSASRMQKLDHARTATNFENVISLAFYPAMLLMGVVIAFALQLIYKEYRNVYNPERYGRSRKNKLA